MSKYILEPVKGACIQKRRTDLEAHLTALNLTDTKRKKTVDRQITKSLIFLDTLYLLRVYIYTISKYILKNKTSPNLERMKYLAEVIGTHFCCCFSTRRVDQKLGEHSIGADDMKLRKPFRLAGPTQ
jgi:hypothetical protein